MIRERLDSLLASARRVGSSLSAAGPAGTPDGVGTRIVVLGGYGRPELTRWLYRALDDRGYDTYARVAGGSPERRNGGFEFPVTDWAEFSVSAVADAVARVESANAVIIENDSADDEQLWRTTHALRPHLVMLPAVGRGVAEKFGTDRRAVVRAFARAVPAGAYVVSAERNVALFDYLAAELDRRGAICTRAIGAGGGSPCADWVAVVDHALERVDGVGLSRDERSRFLDSCRPTWTDLADGRVFDAMDVPDAESIERLRRALDDTAEGALVPVVCIRSGRLDRVADLVEYLNWLAGWSDIKCAHVVGSARRTIERRLDVPVHGHDPCDVTPSGVLDAACRHGRRVLLLANAESSFVTGLREAVEARAAAVTVGTFDRGTGAPANGITGSGQSAPRESGTHRSPAVPRVGQRVLVMAEEGAPVWRDTFQGPGPVLTITCSRDAQSPVPAEVEGAGDSVIVSGIRNSAFETIDDPADLDTIADLIDSHLADWDGAAILRLDSATALVQAAGPWETLGFLRAILDLVASRDATLYLRLDPGAHSHGLLKHLGGLFDEILEAETAQG